MALYALGDLHLSFQSEKRMDRFGRVWVNHEEKILRNCREVVTDRDTLVLVGDHSWGKKLDKCQLDLQFISELPGRKILIRGNHDTFWNPKKTQALNDLYDGRLFFLQNNFFSYEDYAIVGTKGYCYEGFDSRQHADMLIEREAKRLKLSFEAARQAGYDRFVMFLHYPPTEIGQSVSRFTLMAGAYGVKKVIYAHCHGEERFHDSLLGKVGGIEYSLVSGDFLNFRPKKIM